MKDRSISKLLWACMLAGFMSSAWSVPILDAGSTDLLKSSTRLSNPSEASETAWASNVLGFSVTVDERLGGSGLFDTVTGSLGLSAIDFGSDEPGYFFLKTGGGLLGLGNTHFLFENVGSLRYGVVNLSTLGWSVLDVVKLSPTMLNRDASVPEPASLALFAVAFAGLVVARRRAARRKARGMMPA